MLRPLGNKIVVELLTNEQPTADGSFVIPDTVEEPTVKYGKVVVVGEGKYIEGKLVPLSVKENDLVYFPKFSGTEIVLSDDTKYTIISDNDILCIND